MDARRNAPVSGVSPASSKLDFLYGDNMEGGEDMSLEWLSIFIEDCLSSTTSFQPPPTPNHTTTQLPNPQPPTLSPEPLLPLNTTRPSFPSKSRTMRKKLTQKAHPYGLNHPLLLEHPPLLHQSQWLAESELIFPKKDQKESSSTGTSGEEKVGKEGQQPRRCTHCLSQRTPQWRAGPMGPKTLCNACGVRFKSGRLLPEYRPAKSPTFVSYKHSNSHKKVMEMRMAIPYSNTN